MNRQADTPITGPWRKARQLGLTNIRATADGVVGEIGEYSVGIREVPEPRDSQAIVDEIERYGLAMTSSEGELQRFRNNCHRMRHALSGQQQEIDDQYDQIDYWKHECEEARAKHNELLYAVATKHPVESRHETALRYIQQAENRPVYCADAAPQPED